jgi:cytoskeletal protein RodZ
MKFTLRKRSDRGWPNYLFWGRMRTSTFALLVAFFLTAWLYDTYKPPPAPTPEVTQVVPPGFVPDPEYTWVPRTSVREYPQTTTPRRTTTTTTPTTTPTTPTTPSETDTETTETTETTPTTTPPNPLAPFLPEPSPTPTPPSSPPGFVPTVPPVIP